MAKRKIELFAEINSEKDFEHALKNHAKELICAEIFCNFAGHCTSMDKLLTVIKLDWSDGKLIVLKVRADEISALERFKDHSEPVFMFILNHRVTKVYRGVNSQEFSEISRRELDLYNIIHKGGEVNRPTYGLHEPTPDEAEWMRKISIDKQLEVQVLAANRARRLAARKRHRAQRMVPYLTSVNFVLFWPHCWHAHPELYEKWDPYSIIMVAREEISLTEECARDVLYSGDAPLNEASLHRLLSAPALAICFRILDEDKHFVSLVRHILYEELPVYDERKSLSEQRPRITCFDYYKTHSLTKEQALVKKKKALLRRREEALQNRARRLAEMQRLARQEIEDARNHQAKEREQKRLQLLNKRKLEELKIFDETPDEEIDIEVPEELPDEYVEEASDEDPDEYLPPPGFLIPGFYAPPNDVAKTNGLAILFPKIVGEYVTPEPEFLPPHVLVMLEVSKRYDALRAIAPQKKALVHMGIFQGKTPQNSKHVAHSVKQYDSLDTDSVNPEETVLAFMLSIEKDLPLLLLMELCPSHVSRDVTSGDDECAAMFAVDYADDYPEFEDFDE